MIQEDINVCSQYSTAMCPVLYIYIFSIYLAYIKIYLNGILITLLRILLGYPNFPSAIIKHIFYLSLFNS